MTYLVMWKFFRIFVELLVNVMIVIRVKNVSKPMDVQNTYTNLYTNNLAIKSYQL